MKKSLKTHTNTHHTNPLHLDIIDSLKSDNNWRGGGKWEEEEERNKQQKKEKLKLENNDETKTSRINWM